MKKVYEDAPTVNAGSGNVAGIGVGAKGEPGVPPRFQPKKNKTIPTKSVVMSLMRRAPVNMVEDTFAGAAVFEVAPSVFHSAKFEKRKGRHWRKYLEEDDCLAEVREYANKNQIGRAHV